MAHEIEMIGDRTSMAYFGETPWHNLGTPLTTDDLYDWPSVCEKSGLDWEAELVPLLTADTQAKVEHKAVRRKTDGRILGVVGPKYHVLQNFDAFKWFQPFLEAKEAALHTAGTWQSTPARTATIWNVLRRTILREGPRPSQGKSAQFALPAFLGATFERNANG